MNQKACQTSDTSAKRETKVASVSKRPSRKRQRGTEDIRSITRMIWASRSMPDADLANQELPRAIKSFPIRQMVLSNAHVCKRFALSLV
jgi:hypothetical protein